MYLSSRVPWTSNVFNIQNGVRVEREIFVHKLTDYLGAICAPYYHTVIVLLVDA